MATGGTLYELDMILSVTQRTINDQLSLLFTTPLPDKKSEYLIDHHLRLGFLTKTKKDPKTGQDVVVTSPAGLDVEVFAPTIDINDVPHLDYPRSVRINFHIDTGTLTYIDSFEMSIIAQDVSGYRMSWVANLGRRTVPDVSKAKMHPEAKKKIEAAVATKYEGSTDFLVSSLFCKFENAQVIESFELYDENNKMLTTKDSCFAEFINRISTHFSHLPDDENPYVLGYGIQQKVTNPVGEALFAPSEYIFSTTPWPYTDGEDKTEILDGQATVNFLILGQGTHNQKLVTIKENPKVGIITDPFVRVTKSPKDFSFAYLAVSQRMFYENYVKPKIIDIFVVQSPTKLGGKSVESKGSSSTTESRRYSQRVLWSVPTYDIGNTEFTYSGGQTLLVEWFSKLQDTNLPTELAADVKRQLIFNITGHVTMSYKSVYREASHVHGAAPKRETSTYDTDVKYSANLKFTTGAEGKWVLDEKTLDFPERDPEGKLKLSYDESQRPSPSKWYESVLSQIGGVRRITGADELKKYLAVVLDPILSREWENSIIASIAGLRQQIILPAGDVFDFKGLDVDSYGHLYSHLSYKSIIDPDAGGRT